MSHFYILYQVTNKINNKFYIGIHKTNNIQDDYYGSGHKIKAAIEKYGKENFKKEILQVFTNGAEAFKREKELVTDALVKDNSCYNIKEGGHGGFDHIRAAGLHKSVLGSRVMHNPETGTIKKAKSHEIQQLLDHGWVFGYSASAKQRMSTAGKVKIQTKDHRKKNSDTKKNSIIMINNITKIKKFIKQDLVSAYINTGWSVYNWKFLKSKKECN
jgi:hypothetical protein